WSAKLHRTRCARSRCLALRVQIWILSCHRFTACRGDEAVICCHENQRWQAMSNKRLIDDTGGGSCWIPGSYTPCTGLKHLILNGFFQRCHIGRDPRGKPVKTTCYAKLDPLRPWNPT